METGHIILRTMRTAVPVSVMPKICSTHTSWKTSYYQNTMDGKTEDVIEELPSAVDDAANVMSGYEDDEDCEPCAI